MADESIHLFAPGALGTCWSGKYHYFEPWAGCEHDCDYCYARFRGPVVKSLADLKTTFEHPKLLMPIGEMLGKISGEIESEKIEILKLSRYTDIFSPSFVADGTAFDLLGALLKTTVRRLIITTKGVPSRELIDLMIKNAGRVSYNLVAKSVPLAAWEAGVAHRASRLEAAAMLHRGGVKTWVLPTSL